LERVKNARTFRRFHVIFRVHSPFRCCRKKKSVRGQLRALPKADIIVICFNSTTTFIQTYILKKGTIERKTAHNIWYINSDLYSYNAFRHPNYWSNNLTGSSSFLQVRSQPYIVLVNYFRRFPIHFAH